MTESGTGRSYATPLTVNCTEAPLTVIVVPDEGTPLAFITLLNQIESPDGMPVPLKFELIVLTFEGELCGAGAANAAMFEPPDAPSAADAESIGCPEAAVSPLSNSLAIP